MRTYIGGSGNMNGYTKAFSIVIWVGILANATFWVPALFHPETLSDILDIEPDIYTVWLRNVGMLLILVGIWNAAAALAPARYPLVSWFVVLARLIAASFFFEIWLFNSLNSSDRPEVFMWFFIGDGTFAIIKGILLYFGLRQISRGSVS